MERGRGRCGGILWSSYLVVLSAVVLVVARDDRSIALVSVVSWVIVTPDAATPARIACGAALSLGWAAVAT